MEKTKDAVTKQILGKWAQEAEKVGMPPTVTPVNEDDIVACITVYNPEINDYETITLQQLTDEMGKYKEANKSLIGNLIKEYKEAKINKNSEE